MIDSYVTEITQIGVIIKIGKVSVFSFTASVTRYKVLYYYEVWSDSFDIKFPLYISFSIVFMKMLSMSVGLLLPTIRVGSKIQG